MEPSILHTLLYHTSHNLEGKDTYVSFRLTYLSDKYLQLGSVNYPKPSASVQMRRSGTKQKQQVLHMYIPSSQYRAHRDPKAIQGEHRLLTCDNLILQMTSLNMRCMVFGDEVTLTSAICTKICWGYCGSNTS